jgi:predicted O-methyltransferase YrrM
MKERIDAILRRNQAEYLDSLLVPRDALLERMEKFAAENDHPIADPEVAQLMRVLVRITRPRRLLEIGTNIGYSVVVLGRECDPEAVMETIEIDHNILSTARRFIEEAQLPCRVVFHEGAALEVLPRLTGPFDFVFIDCVKTEYGDYLDAIVPKMQLGSVIVYDNLLWKGRVATGDHDGPTDALRAFNKRISNDPRLITSLLPLGDGTGVSVVV